MATSKISDPHPTGMVNKDSRYDFIDAGRCIAVLAVLTEHLVSGVYPWFQESTKSYFSFGIFGVTLFFLISGYIIPPSIARGGLPRFWIARFFRLYPLYWLAIGAALLTAYYFGHPNLSNFNLRWIVANLTMLHEYVRVPSVIELSWTLSMEMLFYFLCTFLYLFFDVKKWGYWMITLGIIGVTVVAVANLLLLKNSLPLGRLITISSALFGMHLWSEGWFGRRTYIVMALAALAIVICGLVRFSLMPPPRADGPNFTAFCAISSWLAAYVTFFVLFRMREFKFPRWVIYIGTLCYSIYLTHSLVIWTTLSLPKNGLWILLNVTATLTISALLYNFFEKPIIDFGRRFYKKLYPST